MKKLLSVLCVVVMFIGCTIPCEQMTPTVGSNKDEPQQCLDCNFNCLLPCKASCDKQQSTDVASCYDICRAQCCTGLADK